jgi:transporter family protein
MGWAAYAALSAVFAGLTALLAKIGVEGVPSNVATMIRTVVIVIFAAGIVAARGELHHVGTIATRTWVFLVLSGIATGLSWLCYFAALKAGPISAVAPIDKLSFVLAAALGVVFLHEKVTRLSAVGILLILCGVLLTLPTVQESLAHRFAHGLSGETDPGRR